MVVGKQPYASKCETLKLLGTTATASQGIHLSMTPAALMKEYVFYWSDPANSFAQKFQDPTFDSYWKPEKTVVLENLDAFYGDLMPKFGAFVAMHHQEDVFYGEMDNVLATMTQHIKGFHLPVEHPRKNRRGVPMNTTTWMLLLKYMFPSQRGRTALGKYLTNVKPTVENNPVDTKTALSLHSAKWIQKNIHNPVIDVGMHLKKLVMCEFAILHHIRNNAKNQQIQEILEKEELEHSFCDFINLEYTKRNILNKTKIQESSFGGVARAMSPFLQRALHAMLHQLYVDVFETIVAYGISPKMKFNDHLSGLSRLTLQNGDKIRFPNDHLRAYLL